MEFNKTECPHAVVLVSQGIPCVIQPMCGKIGCVSLTCQDKAKERPCTCPHVNDYYHSPESQKRATEQAASCSRHKA